MTNQLTSIPLEIQLEAVCKPTIFGSKKIMESFISGLRDWDIKVESYDTYKKYLSEFFSFTPIDLINFQKIHPEICQALYMFSIDKRYSPSTFLSDWENGQYRVGWVNRDEEPLIIKIHVFSTFAEATADYVLFSWDFPRLTKEQATWYEMDNY